MKRLLFVATSVTLAACSNRIDGAMRVEITLETALKADCFEVDVLSKGQVQAFQTFTREAGKNVYQLGMKQGDLPANITLQAKAYVGNCEDPAARQLNSVSPSIDRAFPVTGLDIVQLKLSPPDAALDNDRDGFVDVGKGGPDCNDGDSTILPGGTQICGSLVDNNCNGKIGCADPGCAAEASCAAPATKLAFNPGTISIQRNGCSQEVLVEARTAAGAVTPVPFDTTVTLTPSAAGISVLADCAGAPITKVVIPYNTSTARMRVRPLQTQVYTVTASATGLAPGALTVDVQPLPTSSIAFTSAAQSIVTGDCSAQLIVALRDSAGQPTTAAADTALEFTTTATAGFEFFDAADGACGTPLSAPFTATVLKGQGTTAIRARATQAAFPNVQYSLTAKDAAGHTDAQTLTVRPGAGVAVAYTSSQPGPLVNGCSSAVTLQLQDAFGNRTANSTATTIGLSTTGGPSGGVFEFFSSNSCGAGNKVTQATIAANTSSVNVFVKANTVGQYTMVATAFAKTVTQIASIAAGPPTKLKIITAAQSLVSGACSAVLTVQAQDLTNAPSSPAGNITVNVTPNTGGSLFADASCGTALPSNQLIITAGTTSSNLYFRGSTAGTSNLVVAATSFTGDQQAVTIVPGPPSVLKWGTPSTVTVAAGACSTLLQLRIEDAAGNLTAYTSAQTLNLVSTPAGPLFSGTAGTCAGAGAQISVVAAATTVSVYSTYTLPGSFSVAGTINATSTATPATLTVIPAPATKLVYRTAPPGSIVAGVCAQVDVDRKDGLDNLSPTAAGGATVALASTGVPAGGAAGGPPLYFTSSATCTAGTPSVTSVTIPGLASTVTYWTRARTIGTATMTATEGSLTPASSPMVISPAAASKLRLTSAPATMAINTCTTSALVERLDPYDNLAPDAAPLVVTITPTGSPNPTGFKYFTDPACATLGTAGVTINSGLTSAAFSFSSTTAGSLTVTASSGSVVTSSAVTVTVNPGAATLLFKTAPPTTAVAGGCAQVDVERKDSFGNFVNVTANTAINLSSTGIVGGGAGGPPLYFNTSACTGGGVGSVQMNNGTGSVSFWVKGRTTGTATITAQELVSGPSVSSAMTVTPAAASRLGLVIAPTTLTAGACSTSGTVTRYDAFDNLAPDGTALVVTLASSGAASAGVLFYSAATCPTGGTVGGSVTILSGSSSNTFGLAGTRASPAPGAQATITATSSLPTTSTVLNFTSAAITKIAFASNAGNVAAGTCAQNISLQSRDQYDNPSNVVGAALSIALSTNVTPAATFYPSVNCTGGPLTATAIAPATNTIPTSFIATKAAQTTVTADPAPYYAAITQDWTVDAGAPNKLVFKGAQPSSVAAYACSGTPVTVQVLDTYNNSVPLSAARVFQFNSSNALSGVVFSSTATTCAPLLTSNQLSVGAGVGEFSGYLMPLGIGSPTNVSVSDTSGSPLTATGNTAVTVTGSAGSLVVTAPSTVEYGACVAVTVERQVTGSPWIIGSTAVSLASSSGDLTVHTNAACSTTGSLTIAPLASLVTFYVKGHSGPGSTVTLTASDGASLFANGTATPTPLPLVRRGTCTIAASTASVSCAISPAIPGGDISRTFLISQAKGVAAGPDDGSVECHLASAGVATVDCMRFANTGGAQDITWQTASYGAGTGVTVSRRVLTQAQLTGTAPVVDTFGPAVPLANSFLLFSMATAGAAYSATDFATGYLTDAGVTTSTAAFHSGGSPATFPATVQLSYEVVQLPGSAVDRGQVVPGSGSSVTATIASVAAPTAVLHSTRWATGSANDGDICRKSLRGVVTSNTVLTFTRGNGAGGSCTNVDAAALAWERIRFPASTTSQTASVAIPISVTTATSAALGTSVLNHRTLVFQSGQGPGGQSAGETTRNVSELGYAHAVVDLSGCASNLCTTVTATRGTSNGTDTSNHSAFVVTFPP